VRGPVFAVHLALEVVANFKIEVAVISRVGLAADGTLDRLILLYCELLVEVEDSLTPMCVRRPCQAHEPRQLFFHSTCMSSVSSSQRQGSGKSRMQMQGRTRSRREPNGLVNLGEATIEPHDHGSQVVVARRRLHSCRQHHRSMHSTCGQTSCAKKMLLLRQIAVLD
jgi:hypothetical protein